VRIGRTNGLALSCKAHASPSIHLTLVRAVLGCAALTPRQKDDVLNRLPCLGNMARPWIEDDQFLGRLLETAGEDGFRELIEHSGRTLDEVLAGIVKARSNVISLGSNKFGCIRQLKGCRDIELRLCAHLHFPDPLRRYSPRDAFPDWDVEALVKSAAAVPEKEQRHCQLAELTREMAERLVDECLDDADYFMFVGALKQVCKRFDPQDRKDTLNLMSMYGGLPDSVLEFLQGDAAGDSAGQADAGQAPQMAVKKPGIG
jgi:hypothetical protein